LSTTALKGRQNIVSREAEEFACFSAAPSGPDAIKQHTQGKPGVNPGPCFHAPSGRGDETKERFGVAAQLRVWELGEGVTIESVNEDLLVSGLRPERP
jgi:hypothetical protein